MPSNRIISADSHVNEPPDLFKNVPVAVRDIVPQLVSLEKGDAWILAPGTEPRMVATSAVAGRKKEEYLAKPISYANMRPGGFKPAPRVEDMDIDHIDAEVLYPGIMRYQERLANSAARAACCRAYNEWITDFDRYDSRRLAGVGVVPLLDDDNGNEAVKALHEARKIGLKTAFLPQKNGGMPLQHPEADKFWAAATELDMPVSIHIHTNPFARGTPPEYANLPGHKEMALTTAPIAMAEHLALLVFGGVFKRHPKLKVVLAECGIGWIPPVLERMDSIFKVHRHYLKTDITELPSDTFKSHCYATFQEDVSGVTLRHMLGVDNIMWASDYPHTDTTWPESRPTIDRMFANVDATERHKMVCDNAARLYGFERTAAN